MNKVSNSEANVTTVVPVSSDQIDNGTVNKLVYNTYRELLGAYHKKANVVLSSTPGVKVVEGKGVTMQLESLAYVSFCLFASLLLALLWWFDFLKKTSLVH